MTCLVSTHSQPAQPSEQNPCSNLLDLVEHAHPRTFGLLDPDLISSPVRIAHHAELTERVDGHHDFKESARGGAYREMQRQVPLAREFGDRRIFELLASAPGGLTERAVGADIIGGNGTCARVAARLLPADSRPYIITSDPCLAMVEDALAQGLPALWQAGHATLFSPGVLSWVLGSRGFHHIPESVRPEVASEAFRVLEPHGRVLFIDMEEGTPSARFYSEALDAYTETGHDHAHFTRDGFGTLLREAGFSQVEVFPLYDPFIFRASSADAARSRLLAHLVKMFGMVRLARPDWENELDYADRLDSVLAPFADFAASDVAFEPAAVRRLSVFQERPGVWRAEYPRVVLCASGVKSPVQCRLR
jgi:SAM-dependent methyltransferase